MIKKIPIGDLKPGMYIHELGVSWVSHPFFRHRFLVKSDKDVARIVATGIQALYIDTDRGLDAPNAPTQEEVSVETHRTMECTVVHLDVVCKSVAVAEEMPRARNALQRTQAAVRRIFKDVRLGQAPQLFNIEEVVDEVAKSVTSNHGALLSLLRLRNKNDYTFHHSVAVGVMLITFARALEQGPDELRESGIGGLLHDLGKLAVSDSILSKPGPLTDKEFEAIKLHSVQGHRFMTGMAGIGSIPLEIALHHHERINGTGYPSGLAGDQIPLHARMASIVDVYDAITSERCYHAAIRPTEALRKMFEWRESQFDQRLLSLFIRTIGIYPVGSLVRLESGRLAVVTQQNDSDALRPTVRTFFNPLTKCFIPLKDIDLAAPVGSGGADRIVADESPEKWHVDPMQILSANIS